VAPVASSRSCDASELLLVDRQAATGGIDGGGRLVFQQTTLWLNGARFDLKGAVRDCASLYIAREVALVCGPIRGAAQARGGASRSDSSLARCDALVG
jgi:hypothetical protein